MKPYSSDLRQKIVDAYENNEGSIRQLAKRFNVSTKFVNDLLQHYRKAGTVAPKSYTHGPSPTLQAAELNELQALVEQDNDATLEQLAERLFERTRIRVSITTIHRGLRKLNLSRKKKTFKASEAYTERVQNLRVAYW